MQSQRSIVRIVAHARGPAVSRRPMEGYRLVGSRLAGIPVKRHGGRRDMNGVRAGLRATRRLQADLHFPGATDLPRVRNKITRLGEESVVALSLFSVHDD